MIATAIPEAMRPYSIAVAPDSSLAKRFYKFSHIIILLRIYIYTVLKSDNQPPDRTDGSCWLLPEGMLKLRNEFLAAFLKRLGYQSACEMKASIGYTINAGCKYVTQFGSHTIYIGRACTVHSRAQSMQRNYLPNLHFLHHKLV